MIRKLLVVLVISLCIFSLSLHFVVEGLGGVQDHYMGNQVSGKADSHEGDQFIVNRSVWGISAQTIHQILVLSSINQNSFPVSPLLHPPKFV
jgi:PDZ domain-containing secreted protein